MSLSCWSVRVADSRKTILVHGNKDQAVGMARVLGMPFRPCKLLVTSFGQRTEVHEIP